MLRVTDRVRAFDIWSRSEQLREAAAEESVVFHDPDLKRINPCVAVGYHREQGERSRSRI
ncbi:MAG TPA: hypothetical protein VF614_18010 [Chthoniobacteraceae bacterium]